jgi:hypothetical protein
MEAAEILLALGAGVHKFFQAPVALALGHHLIIRRPRAGDLMGLVHVAYHAGLALLPVPVPMGGDTAMLANRLMPPHFYLLAEEDSA